MNATAAEQRAPPTLCRPGVIAGALVAGELIAALLTLAPADASGRRWEAFGLNSLVVQWIMLLSLSSICLLQRKARRLRPVHLAVASLVIVMVTTLGTAELVIVLLPDSAGGDQTGLVLRMLAIALVVSTLALLSYREHLASQAALARAKQAELEALQARVRPHFLFNTLNSAAALLHVRPAEAENVLLDLGDLFRAALAEPGWVPLRHEIELCQRYLAIEHKRFGERLQVEWRLPEQVEGLFVPLLTIQPLVENAVLHGLDLGGPGGAIRIEILEEPAHLAVVVSNPSGAKRPDTHRGHGLGLSGARARVETATARAGGITTIAEGGTFTARIVLPLASMPKTTAQGLIS